MFKYLDVIWRTVRYLTKDNAYERYLMHHRHLHPELPALSRKAFFVQEQDRKWEGINKCC